MSDDSKKPKNDIFIAKSVYPDAEAVFTAHYKSLEEIKEDCFVVLDTNTLLVPYTTSKDSLDQIRNTYSELIKAKRLIVPAQVAREFAKLRAKKIGEVFDHLSKKIASSQSLTTGNYPLLEGLAEYQQSLTLEKEINKSITQYRTALGAVRDRVRKWTWNDPVSVLYSELFKAGVVKETLVDNEATKEDLSRRQVHKIPPAYKDAAKDDDGVGDLLIWQTILEIGNAEKKSVMFVSHDEKPDWWHQSSGQALYPRYELMDEFRRASEGQTFRMVRLSEFLDLFGASKPVVDEVKEKEIEGAQGENAIDFARRAEASVARWLKQKYQEFQVSDGVNIDFIVRAPDQTIHSVVEVKTYRSMQNFNRRLRELKSSLNNYVYFGAERIFILVANDYELGLILVSRFLDSAALPNASIVIGFLRENSEFAALYSTARLL